MRRENCDSHQRPLDSKASMLPTAAHKGDRRNNCTNIPVNKLYATESNEKKYICNAVSLIGRINANDKHLAVGLLLRASDSVIGRKVLNCVLRYHISLNRIMNLDIQPRGIIGGINANDKHLTVLLRASNSRH